MKTSKILMAMALPLAFAACTAEDVLESTQTDALSNRKVLGDVEIVLDGVESRFVANNGKFTPTAGDGFGAALADIPNFGTSEVLPDNYTITSYIQTNYKYVNEGTGYKTSAEMVEGNYVFYAPYNQKHLSRKPIEVVTPITQTLNVNEDGSVDAFSAINNLLAAEDANPMFVSYQFLPAVNQPTKLNITLKHIFAYPEVRIVNNKTEDVTITKYVIKTNSTFPIKAPLSNEGVKSHLYNWGTEKFTNGVSSYGDWVSSTSFDKNWLVGSTSDILDVTNAPQSDIIVVEIPEGLTIEAGGEVMFHVVLPGQVYANGYKAYAYVNDDEGYVLSGTSNSMTFFPGQRYPQQEFTNNGNTSSRAGELMTTKIGKLAELQEISTSFPVVVSTTTELKNAVLNGTEKFRVIPISDEVAIDADVVAAMRQVNFQGMEIDGDITIKGGATAAATLTLTEDVEINGEALIEGFVKLDKSANNTAIYPSIESAKVAEGSNLNITVAEVGSIENYGTTTVAEKNQDVDVTNYATLNIEAEGYAGTYTAGTATDADGNEYVVPAATINVKATYETTATAFNGIWNVKANMTTAAATINGTMTLDANKVMDGGILTIAAGATFDVNGRVNNEIKLSGVLDDLSTTTVDEYKASTLNVNETAFIKSNVAAATANTAKAANIMNVADGATFFNMTAPAANVTSLYVHTGNLNGETDNNPEIPAVCNTLKIDGSVIASKAAISTANFIGNVTDITITGDVMTNKNGITLGVASGTLTVNGNVEVAGNQTITINAVNDLTIGGNLSIASGSKFVSNATNKVVLKNIDNNQKDSDATLNLSTSKYLTVTGSIRSTQNIIIGVNVVFQGSEILMKNNDLLVNCANIPAAGNMTPALIHVEGNMTVSGAKVSGWISTGNIVNRSINGVNVTVYGNKTLTIAADTEINGVAGVIPVKFISTKDTSSIDETDKTYAGKVVNYGKVTGAYADYDATSGTPAVAVYSWWTAQTGSSVN